MFKNATFLSFYFADNQLFSNSETLVSDFTRKYYLNDGIEITTELYLNFFLYVMNTFL